MNRLAITGGSGILGRALIQRLAERTQLVAISRSEKAQLALRERWPEVEFRLGDVRDADFLGRAFHGCDAVIHAAALKHVPISEREPLAYTSVNVLGSIRVAEVAARLGMRAVGVSTDKACSPLNVYGMTKLLMERVFCELGHVSVRYGNVFGSDGSVLTVWRRQLRKRGEITVTDPEMTRFFFPIGAAVDEVLWALEKAPKGTVVVPRLGAVCLLDLAEAFIEFSGSGAICIVGPRPGEKRHESLLSAAEASRCVKRGGRVLLGTEPSSETVEPIDSATAPRVSREELMSWLGALGVAA